MLTHRRLVRNTRGATLALIAVSMIVVLAMAALAIDLGMLIKTRAEAQRTADAGALAAASAFLGGPAVAQVPEAIRRALEVAANNTVDGSYVDTTGQTQQVSGGSTWAYTAEATVEVVPNDVLVRVTIQRRNVGTWFAEVFGIQLVPVLGRAAAVAAATGAARCVKPFAVPDMWDENSAVRTGGPYFETGDTDSDLEWDSNEHWVFDDATSPYNGTDYYEAYDPNVASGTQTGYGSPWRNGNGSGVVDDYGRPMIIKAQSPTAALGPGFFYPWRLPGLQGAQDYQDAILGCPVPDSVVVGAPYDVETGNMVGPTNQAIDSLIALDPNAQWDPVAGQVTGVDQTLYGTDWRNSPRVIKVAMMDPHEVIDIHDGGHTNVTFNNFALLFLEGFQGSGNQAPLIARFLWFVSGTGNPGGGPGSLVRVLQLVE
jgi:hypothetical protein